MKPRRFLLLLNRRDLGGLGGVLAAAWVVRALVIATWPVSARSVDLSSWQLVAQQLREGHNPYITTHVLNWPPLWMVVIYAIDHLTRFLGVSFFLGVRVFLVAAESVLIVVVHRLLSGFVSRPQANRLVLVGLSLNPIAILLTCQHGNFDVLVGLSATAAVLALTRVQGETGWLAAATAIGLGALTKTVPLILAPLLVPGLKRITRLGRALGLLALVAPIAFGLAVVYVLAPSAVSHNVLGYRSTPGYFGVTGVLDLLHGGTLTSDYQHLFPILILLALVVFARLAPVEPRRIVLGAATLLMGVAVIGPGWGPQYAYWFMPLLVVAYPLFDKTWRRRLLICFLLGCADYLFEYALLPTQGQFLVAWFPHLKALGNALSSEASQTLLRLPLFIALFSLLITAARRTFILRSRTPPLQPVVEDERS